jgi:hypothetical protein
MKCNECISGFSYFALRNAHTWSILMHIRATVTEARKHTSPTEANFKSVINLFIHYVCSATDDSFFLPFLQSKCKFKANFHRSARQLEGFIVYKQLRSPS